MQVVQNFINNKRILSILSLFILFLYFLPYFIYGQNVHMTIFDNLDSNIVWFKILAQSGKIFSDSMDIIPNMMNGLPRLSFGSEFNIILWFYYFFDAFTAYIINDILVHIIAFFGMLTLLSKYIIDKNIKYYNLVIFSIALLFSLIPFWSNAGVSVAGQPLALYAFLNIRSKQDNKWDWIIIIFLPFYSSFVLAFFFFLSAAGLLFIYDLVITRKINYKFLFSIVLMIAINLLIEYRLFYNMIIDSSSFISHRSEFNLFIESFDTVFKNSHIIFLNGQDHNINLHYRYILPIILLGLIVSSKNIIFGKTSSAIILIALSFLFVFDLWGDILTKKFSLPLLLLFGVFIWLFSQKNRIFPFLFITQIIISYITGFYYYEGMNAIRDIFPIVGKFHFARFMMLQTLIWYLLLAFSLNALFKHFKFSIWILISLVIAQTVLAFENRSFTRINFEPASYKTYYSVKQFQEIADYIGKPKSTYRTVNIGIEPAVNLYNGFFTIDGYSTNYPLSYKHQFRKIIEQHLNSIPKHTGDAFVFDDWGSKLYLMTGSYSTKAYVRNLVLKNIPIDINQLSYLGANYIFSAYEIKDYNKMNLKFLNKFDNNQSYKPIYLYEINLKQAP